MQFERQSIDPGNSGEIEKGIAACLYLKEKEPDTLHWGGIDCLNITTKEALLIERFDGLKQNNSEKNEAKLERLLSLNAEARELLDTTGSSIAEVLINELVALRYELKHKHNGQNHSEGK